MLMRNFISMLSMAAALLLAGGITAFGQRFDRPYGDRPYGDRDPQRQERAMFDRIRMDLDRASGYPYASHDDRKRFDEARRELFDFASRFDQGRYDKHELDE